jgi:zinc protease
VTFTLPNGLKVVLEENHSAPVVALQAWVKVGSADETPDIAGIAHVFEHMLFKGTKKRGVGQIAREVEAAGGEINAWTSYDETVYHLILASDFLATGLDILADALQRSTFDATELERERKVVLEEIKQGQDDPDRQAAQGLFETAFDVHPYGRPIIGSVETVTRLERRDLLRFFARHYVAANTTLVIVGDFDGAAVRRSVTAAFSGMSAGSAQGPRAPQPAQRAPRVRAVARDVKEAQVLLGFRSPSIDHDDVPALDLLAVVLGQGDSSRLHLEVVRNRQLVTSASAYGYSPRDPGIFTVSANLPPGRVDEAVRALLDETLRLVHEPIAPEELAKSRAILESERVFDKETVQGYARRLGYFASIAGDTRFEERYFERLRRLDAAELARVAARTFRTSGLTVFAQIPEASPTRQAARAERMVSRLREVVGEAEARATRRWSRTTVVKAADPVSRHVLPNGMRVLILRDPSVPIVAVRGAWVGGLRYEDESSNGISNLIANLLTRGTRTRSAEVIAATVEEMAGSLGGFSGRNSLGLQADFLSRDFDKGLELVADCLQNATFAEEELDKERRLVLDEIRAQDDNLGHVAFQLFHEAMWKNHPYRLDQLGTRESLAGLTRRKLINHFRANYRPSGLSLAIVGDVDPDRAVSRLRNLFAGDSDGEEIRREPPAVEGEPDRTEPVQAFKFLSREQAHVVLGFPGTTLDAPDRFPLEVLSQILSGQSGRLFLNIREKHALAYRVSAFALEGLDPGYFAVYLATSPENLDEALGAARAELRRLIDEDVPAAELDRTQRYLIGSHAIGLQRKGALAALLAFNEAYGQGWKTYRHYAEKIRKVSAADVRRVARKYLDPRREILAVVKPGSTTPAAAKRSPAAAAARGGRALEP